MKPSPPLQPLPSRRRKVSIEIYFVLYLSSIILLLGTTPSRQNDRENELEEMIRELVGSDFRVKVEKAALLYSFIPTGVQLDTSGVFLRRDSMNVISAHGTFAKVQFRILSIEDSATGKKIPPGRAALVQRSDRTAMFRWRALPGDGTGAYRVTVAGLAEPLPPTNIRGDLREKVADILRRRGYLTDSVSFIVNIFAVSDPAMLRRVTRIQATSPAGGTNMASIDTAGMGTQTPQSPGMMGLVGAPFELTPSNAFLPVPPGKGWRNRLSLTGSTSMQDLVLSVSGGDASIVERTPSFVVIGGTAPATGEQQITINAKRISDGRPVTAAFTIRSTAMPDPPLPEAMLLGQSYRLDFTSTGIESERIAVEVIENGKTTISKGSNRSLFNYEPAAAGEIRFIRYLDDQIVGQYEIDIVPIPIPVADHPTTREGATEVTITTRSFGMINGQPNRTVLKIRAGNADDPDELDAKFDQVTKVMRQTWVVRRRSKGEKFEFSYYAIDQRGSKLGKSKERTFSAN